MTTTFNGRFDGKVIVPEGPVNLPQGEKLVVHVESASTRPEPTPGRDLMALAGSITPQEARLMNQTIEDGCEQVDADAW